MRTLVFVVFAGCNFGGDQAPAPVPPQPRPVEDRFLVHEPGSAEDIATAPGGDIIVVGCEQDKLASGFGSFATGATFVRRLDPRSRAVRWTRRSDSPCGHGDNWTVPRVAITETGTIWVAAYGWGRGRHAEQAPVTLLEFDGAGTLGAQHDLPDGIRVRAMVGLAGDRFAFAGQSALARDDRSTAFVAVHAGTKEQWRRVLPSPHAFFVHALVRDGDRLLVSGATSSTIADDPDAYDNPKSVARGRESDAVVYTLGPGGAITSTMTRHHAEINVDDAHVAVVDGRVFLVMKLGQRRNNPWPRTLPPMPAAAYSAIVVEPLDGAWRKVFTGTTHASVDGFAATHGRLAFVSGLQAGELDYGRGPWRSEVFNTGAFVELSAADGRVLDARKLETSGESMKVFFRRLIWDGEAFIAVGQVEGQLLAPYAMLVPEVPFVWRFGVVKTT